MNNNLPLESLDFVLFCFVAYGNDLLKHNLEPSASGVKRSTVRIELSSNSNGWLPFDVKQQRISIEGRCKVFPFNPLMPQTPEHYFWEKTSNLKLETIFFLQTSQSGHAQSYNIAH